MVLKITMGRSGSMGPIRIISTYAPYNEHKLGVTEQRRNDVTEILNQTCKRHMIIGRAVANGHIAGGIGHRDENGGEKRLANVVGSYAQSGQTEKAMGRIY